ncbi:hypothetical protein Hanom_Chr14g01324371 [Helianthus anomalus]
MVSSNNSQQPSSWTSSEDEPDAMDEDSEGFSLIMFSFKFCHVVSSVTPNLWL